MKRLLTRGLYLAYFCFYSFVYIGFLLHESITQQIGQYSIRYFIFLTFLFLGFLIPFLIKIIAKTYGSQTVVFSVIPTIITLAAIYFITSTSYYYTQENSFHPFLQFSNTPYPSINSLKKSKDAIRILTLGGSTTAGYGLPPEYGYVSVLTSIIQKNYPDRDIQVFNAATEWLTSKHSLLHYIGELKEWNPDIAIILHAFNDLEKSFFPNNWSTSPYHWSWKHAYGQSADGLWPPTFEEYLFRFPFLSTINKLWYKQSTAVDFPLQHYVSIKDSKRHLKSLISYLKHDGVIPILMTQPSLYRPNNLHLPKEINMMWIIKKLSVRDNWIHTRYPTPKSMHHAMKAFNQQIINLADQENTILIDLENLVIKDAKNFIDGLHYSKEGARQIGEIVARVIINKQLIQQ